MKLENIEISKLKKDPTNPNVMTADQAARLSSSVKRFGYLQPIIVDENDIILDGAHRLDELIAEGKTKAEIIRVTGLSSAEKKLLRQSLNKIHGEHDEKLDIEDLKLILSDIDRREIKALLGDDETFVKVLEDLDGPGPDPDIIPDKVPSVSKLGDLFQLGNHYLMCGDATKKEDVDKLVPGGAIDMVFTDPPYAVSIGKKNRDLQSIGVAVCNTDNLQGDDLPVEEISEWIWKPAFENISRVLKEGGGYYVTAPQGGDQLMMMMMMMMKGSMPCRHELIWVKSSPTFSMGRLDYSYQHEPILYGWKGKNRRFYGENERSVWNIDKAQHSKLHPTMKPVELVERAIKNSSKTNNTVLDLFGGSGSTLIACEKTNRICYMMEIDPHYIDIIIARWEKFTNKKAAKVKSHG